MSEEEKEFSYPKVRFSRKRVKESGIELIHLNMYSIVIDQHLGEELEVDFDGYYPYNGEIDFHIEMMFSQMFHEKCYITYMTGMLTEDIDYTEEDAKNWTKKFDIRDNGRFD